MDCFASLAMTAPSQGRRKKLAPTAAPKNSFRHHNNLFPETAPKPSRSSAQRRRKVNRPASLFQHRRMPRRSPQSSGDDPCRSVLHFYPPPPFAFCRPPPPPPPPPPRPNIP